MFKLVLRSTLRATFCSNITKASQAGQQGQTNDLNQLYRNEIEGFRNVRNQNTEDDLRNKWLSTTLSSQSLTETQQKYSIEELEAHKNFLEQVHLNAINNLNGKDTSIPLVLNENTQHSYPMKYLYLANYSLIGLTAFQVFAGSYSYGCILGTIAAIPLVNHLFKLKYPSASSKDSQIEWAYLLNDGKIWVKPEGTDAVTLQRSQLKVENRNESNFSFTINDKSYELSNASYVNISKIKQLIV